MLICSEFVFLDIVMVSSDAHMFALGAHMFGSRDCYVRFNLRYISNIRAYLGVFCCYNRIIIEIKKNYYRHGSENTFLLFQVKIEVFCMMCDGDKFPLAFCRASAFFLDIQNTSV